MCAQNQKNLCVSYASMMDTKQNEIKQTFKSSQVLKLE